MVAGVLEGLLEPKEREGSAGKKVFDDDCNDDHLHHCACHDLVGDDDDHHDRLEEHHDVDHDGEHGYDDGA